MATNRPELIILRGLQASGKSTWAHGWVAQDRGNRVRINKDDLRTMIDRGVYTNVTEGRILAARDALVKAFLLGGVSVVVDDTNLKQFHAKKLARIAHQGGWDWSVKNFFDVPLEECIRRDLTRGNTVEAPTGYLGKAILTETYNKFLKGKQPPIPTLEDVANVGPKDVQAYLPDTNLPMAIIIDIDGTLALHGTRSPFDEARVNEDIPNARVVEAVQMEIALGHYPIFCSGRTDACREATVAWLHQHVLDPLLAEIGYVPYALMMRATGDARKDSIMKMELFDRYIRDEYYVKRVYDDRDQVVEMWRSLGLTCMQVAPGAF